MSLHIGGAGPFDEIGNLGLTVGLTVKVDNDLALVSASGRHIQLPAPARSLP